MGFYIKYFFHFFHFLKCARDEGTVFKDLLKNKNMDDIFVNIFNYINKIVNLVRPTKKIFLALDGPAPRAK